MISWVFKLLKSKTFFVILAAVGLLVFGLDKNKTVNSARVDSTYIQKINTSRFSKSTSKESRKSSVLNNYDDTDTIDFVNAMMETDKKYRHQLDENIHNGEMSNIRNSVNEGTYIDTRISKENDREAYYSNAGRSIATVTASDNKRSYNNGVIRTTRNTYNNTIQNVGYEDNIPSEKEAFNKEGIEENRKVNDSSIVPKYITGSAIPTVENNTSNSTVVPYYGNILISNGNRNIFPEKSDEALHECYFDANAKMKCEKSIITCTENGELGLECKASYYSEGIWHSDPTQLTVENNETWIKEHLKMRTTFSVSKFTDTYFENRYAFTSLIRPDSNTTKSMKLKQVKQYAIEKTRLDAGIEKLIENNNTRTSSSLLTMGTRFGIGHEKVKGDDDTFFEEVKEFLSLFMYSDDSDVHGIVDYWTLMDANNSKGDSEDFALTAMEWFLLNGVNPEYIILTEVMPIGSDVSDIILVIETHEPSDKWILKDMDIVKSEDIYPHGYEALIINEYKYVD